MITNNCNNYLYNVDNNDNSNNCNDYLYSVDNNDNSNNCNDYLYSALLRQKVGVHGILL